MWDWERIKGMSIALLIVLAVVGSIGYISKSAREEVNVDLGNIFTETDQTDQATGLPFEGLILWPDKMPDGHYTVVDLRATSTRVVLHRPGPDRDFVYYVSRGAALHYLPDGCYEGQTFTVFRGKVV